MRGVLLIVGLVFSLTLSGQYKTPKESESNINRSPAEFAAEKDALFNDGWKFQLITEENRNTDFASPLLDDSKWRVLDLPHDFQFEQPWTEKGGGARGFKPSCEGWYRKTFTVPEVWKGLNVKLDFGGIVYLGDVYINGTKVASTDYGYVGMEANLTKHLKYGQEVARHEMQTAGKATKLKIEKEQWMKSEGAINDLSTDRLIYLDVTAIDRKGRLDPEYNEPLTVTVEGGATLYSLDNHDHYTNDLFYNVNTKNMRGGRMQLILRRNNQSGKIVLKVATPSFKQKTTIL